MHIVLPQEPPSEDTLGHDLTAALARLDGCGECVYNTEFPTAAIPHNGGWLCRYTCSDCGHSWTTGWGSL